MDKPARMPSREGHAPAARSHLYARGYRLLRRHRHHLMATLLTLYVTSGILTMCPDDAKLAHALIQIAIGITHWLA
jgi:hypothetical protein